MEVYFYLIKKEEDNEKIKEDIDIDDLLQKWKKYQFE